MTKIMIALTVLLSIGAGQAIAHSGGTDAYGCHIDHSTGLYHCH